MSAGSNKLSWNYLPSAAEASAAVVAVSMADLRLSKSTRSARAWNRPPSKEVTAEVRVATSLETEAMSVRRLRLARGADAARDAKRRGTKVLMKCMLALDG